MSVFSTRFTTGFYPSRQRSLRCLLTTDFKIQKLVLRQSLLEMLGFDREMSGTREEIERLGLRHKQLGVTPEMYAMWLDSLCEAIKKHDPSYTPELEQLWREAMLKSIKEMIAVGAVQGPEKLTRTPAAGILSCGQPRCPSGCRCWPTTALGWITGDYYIGSLWSCCSFRLEE